MWKKKSGQQVTGAIAIDPTALSYLLQVTGPATLPDGEVVSADNVVAAKIFDTRLALDLQRFGSTGDIGREIQAAAPSAIFSAEQLGDLPELPIMPLHRELKRGQAQGWRALPRGIDLDDSGVGKMEISAHWFGLDASAPGIF